MTQGVTSIGQNTYVRNGQTYTVPEGIDPKKALIFQIMQEAEGESKGKVRDYTIKELKAAGLYEGNDRKFFGKKFTNFLGKVILGKEADVYSTARTVATENKMDRIASEGELHKAKDKLEDKLKKAGYTDANGKIDIEGLQQLFIDYAGSDAEITYSTKAAEFKHLQSALNNNGNDVEFTNGEIKQIIKAVGGKKEANIDWLKTARAAALSAGTVGLSGLAMPINVDQNVTLFDPVKLANSGYSVEKLMELGMSQADATKAMNGTAISNKVATNMLPATLLASAAVGAGASIYKQLTRTETPIAEELTDPNVKTLADAKKHFDTVCTKRGLFKLKTDKKESELMTSIAAHFVDPKTGEIDKDAFNNAIRAKAGDQSVLNKKEAWNLLRELDTGRITPDLFKEADCPEPEVVEIVKFIDRPVVIDEEEPDPELEKAIAKKDCPETVTVQAGESPASIAKRYGVDVNELKKLNADKLHPFTNNCGEFIGKGFIVDEEIKLPEPVDCEKAAAESAKNLKGQENINKFVVGVTPLIKNGTLCEDDKAVDANLFRKIKAQQ